VANEPIRVGIVGTGFAGRFHYDALVNAGRTPVQVTGVYSRTSEPRKEFADARGVKAYESFEQMLEEVDVVDVCTPGYAHEPYCVQGAEAGKHVIVEKPFTGFFGPEPRDENWTAEGFPRETMLKDAMASTSRIVEAARKSNVKLMYAENWVYAPAVQKEREIVEKSGAQILWMTCDESHSGSGSPAYGFWRLNGGGSLMGKGCHPLTACLYLKQCEGAARLGKPIRPKSVSARMHYVTRADGFQDAGFLRTDYLDVEDYAQAHITFEDGTLCDVFASEIVLGGVRSWIDVCANNHRCRCNINPNDCLVLFNAKEEQLEDVYLSEKLGTKQGWSFPSPSEDWMNGYQQEIQEFMECVAEDKEPSCGAALGADTVATLYAAYLSDERGGQEVEIPRVEI